MTCAGKGSTPSSRDRVLVLAVPVLLVVVALTQVVVSTTTDLTPWRGGGFGMFSTLDAHSTRHLDVEVVTTGGERMPVAIDRAIRVDEVRRAYVGHQAWPRQHTLDRLARGLRDADLIVVDGIVTHEDGVAVEDSEGATPVDVVEVRVEVWASRFDRTTRQLQHMLLDRGSSRP